MESSHSDDAPQTVSCSDRQPSQTVSCSDRQPSQTVSCSDRQPMQYNDYLARCQQQARYTYTLPPGVSSAGLSEMEIARGDFYLQPNDRYTKRQQDLLDMDEDVGSEDDWTWSKADGGDLESPSKEHDTFCSVESPSPDKDDGQLFGRPLEVDEPPYREPPSPRYRGPPDDPTRNRAGTDVLPPPPMPLPPVPGPPAQRHTDWEEFERHELMTTRWNSSEKFSWNSPELLGRSTECPPEQMGDLTAPDIGRTPVIQPPDCPFLPRCRDARTIANAHLSAAANPQLSRGNVELLCYQRSRESSGATSSQAEDKQHFIRRPDSSPPPLPSQTNLIRRPAKPPPPLPPPCYCFEYFTQCVRITTHWEQHSKALQCFREWCRARGVTYHVLDNWSENILPKQPCGFAKWCADCPTWSWDSLLAQLNDDSLQRIVEGTNGAAGIVACMVRESAFVDKRKRATGNKKNVLYHWEFAFLRDNGTVAFLRPSPSSCRVEYYEGVPIGESAVATQKFRKVTTDVLDEESLPEFCFGDKGVIACRLDKPRERCPNNWFPNISSLKLEYPDGIKFMEHRYTNYDKRGSASRPPPRVGMGDRPAICSTSDMV